MFEDKIQKLKNPFAELAGIYEVEVPPVKIRDSYLCLSIGTYYSSNIQNLFKVIDVFQKKNPKTSITTFLKALGLSEADLAKLGPHLSLKPTKEYWEVTTTKEAIKTMGSSPHFTSCYRGGSQPATIIGQTYNAGLALILRKDSQGRLMERFLVAPITVGEGQFLIRGSLRASNYKGQRSAQIIKNIAEKFLSGEVRKLTEEELKTFKW